MLLEFLVGNKLTEKSIQPTACRREEQNKKKSVHTTITKRSARAGASPCLQQTQFAFIFGAVFSSSYSFWRTLYCWFGFLFVRPICQMRLTKKWKMNVLLWRLGLVARLGEVYMVCLHLCYLSIQFCSRTVNFAQCK